MRELTCTIGFAIAATSFCPAVVNARGECPGYYDQLVNGKAMVTLGPGVTLQQFLNVVNQDFPSLNAQPTGESIPGRPIHLIQFTVPSPAILDQFEQAIEFDDDGPDGMYVQSGLLLWGDLLYLGEAPEGKTGSIWVGSAVTFAAYENQYAVTRIGVPAAHELSTGPAVVVAVLDTGIDASHPQLAGRLAPGGHSFITNSTNTGDVGDGQDNDGDGATDEMVGHGTYVAGLVSLVAPDATLLPVVVLNSDGVGTLWQVLQGVYYAMDRGVEVINMSLSSTYDSRCIEAAMNEARSLGIVVVCATGNFNTDCPREFPAMEDDTQVFGVAALDHQDIKAPFSNFDRRLFISAPGNSVETGGAGGGPNLGLSIVSTIPGGEYRVWEGTSMAAPLVAGSVALIRAQHPEWEPGEAHAAIRQIVMETAVNICGLNPGFCQNGDLELGYGRIDIAAAVGKGPPAPTLGDLNNDGLVNVADLLKVIGDWGLVHSSADLNGDGVVAVNDLLIVITNWD